MKSIKTATVFVATICALSSFSAFSASKGVSPYLPVQLDSMIELEIERLSTIAKMPKLSKPYHIASVVTYLKKVKQSHPELHQRLNHYIQRFKQQSAVTHKAIELSYSNNKDKLLNNARGIEADTNFQLSSSGFYQVNEYFIANGGATMTSGQGVVPHASFLSFGINEVQVDIGYREHWLSPMQESASLRSTNAEAAPSITMSNVSPFTHWNIHYEVSLSLLEEMPGIHFNDKTSSGRPGLLTMHMSAQPLDSWTIGLNRSFMFAGGERSITLSDIWNAVIDPVNSDNCGGTDLVDCDQEVGNQIASITNKFDFSLFDKPMSFYFEYAGEDTKDHKNYQLGNLAYTYGFFLPYLTEQSSLYFEYSDYHSHWYIHHLYDEGYRNDDAIMGHWWANDRIKGDKVGGTTFNIRYNHDLGDYGHIEAKIRQISLNASERATYDTANELELSYKHAYKEGFLGVNLLFGKDINQKSHYRVGINYTW